VENCLTGAMLTNIKRVLTAAAKWALAVALSALAPLFAAHNEFLFGASVYPELQTRPEWNRMLDEFRRAHINIVRVAESSWGNLESAPGKVDFGWLTQFLEDVRAHKMQAILGTSTYIAPQWLIASDPEMLRELSPGVKVHPMGRKAACINHPVYRAACRRYVQALGRAFKDNPAVIGWQLDNEIEFTAEQICYDKACNRAWHDWLQKTYHSAEEFNRRLLLVSWGMKVDSLDQIPQVIGAVDPAGRPGLPALRLADLHFRRDNILDFLAEQRATLRSAGVTQWITTDWNDLWTAFADDPRAANAVDIAGLNFYQPSAETPQYWLNLAWQLDMHRSAQGNDHFLVMETRAGVAGGSVMWDDFPSAQQFRMWMLQPAAYGASSLLFWSGNRWRGGHWPHWGGLLDWSGKPEADFDWYVQLGDFFATYGTRLTANPVRATAAVLTDFDQRATLEVYPHTPASRSVVTESFDALHRLGVGTDAINSARASDAKTLAKYKLVILPAATALDGEAVPAALKGFVESGGSVLITPFTAYQSWDGIFRGDGFGANLRGLDGALVRTARRIQTSTTEGETPHVKWISLPQFDTSPIGVDGYCEVLETDPETKVLAHFENMDDPLEGKPAATLRKLGKGWVMKLAFWPKDDSILALIGRLLPVPGSMLSAPLPRQTQAVPRQDNSLFVINTSANAATIELSRSVTDVLSGRKLSGSIALKKFEVLWLE
jgi:beta-galactosidase